MNRTRGLTTLTGGGYVASGSRRSTCNLVRLHLIVAIRLEILADSITSWRNLRMNVREGGDDDDSRRSR